MTAWDNLNLASRRAQESRRSLVEVSNDRMAFESIVGLLDISKQQLEKEFISCLRNGLIYCQMINEVEPGSVSKLHMNLESRIWFDIFCYDVELIINALARRIIDAKENFDGPDCTIGRWFKYKKKSYRT